MKITLITGASSGLGASFSKLYAKDGCNLLLVGQNQERLEKVKEDALSINNKIDIVTFKADLSKVEELDRLVKYCNDNGYFVNNLVNNAGFGDQNALIDMDLDFQVKMTNVNCIAPLYLMKSFLNNMKDNNEGHIINVASIAGLYPGPYMSTYHASKAYLQYLSGAVAYELRNTNIKVLALCPGPFHSRFVEKAHNDYTFTKIKPVPSESVALFGYKKSLKGKSFAIYGFGNRLTYFISRFFSRKFVISSSAKNITKGGK